MVYSKTKNWIIIGIIATLALGFILGVVADRALEMKRIKYRGKAAKVLAEERLLKRLSRKLDLSMPQIQSIGGILRLQSIKIKELRENQRNKMNLIMKETQEKIKPHLLPDQQRKYDKLIASHQRKWKRIYSRNHREKGKSYY